MIPKHFIHKNNLSEHQKTEESQYSCPIFCQQLTNQIQNFNSNDLTYFLNSTKSKNILIKYPYEVLVTIVSILNSTTESKKTTYHCAKALHLLAICSDPSELILYLIEQMDLIQSHHSFHLLLTALEISLLRSKKILNVIDMVTDIIKKYLMHLPVLNDETESVIYDNTVECVIVSYINISNFIDSLMMNLIFQSNSVVVQNKIEHLFLDCLVSMFDKPICFTNSNQDHYELIFCKIFKNIFLIKFDIINYFSFFNYNTSCVYNKFHWLNSGTTNSFLNISTLSICNFLWIGLYTKTINIIQVYNPHYVAYISIFISNYFISLKKCTNIVIFKSLDIVDYALNILKNYLIPFEALDLSIHKELIQNLTKIIIHNNSVKIQKNAIKLLIRYIDFFDNKAKFMIIKNLINSKENSKIISIVIIILKNILDKILIKSEQKIDGNQYFLNENLEILIYKICFLRNKAEIDLLEMSDELITILNFIIFLIIRSRNFSGMENYLKYIKYNFLQTIEDILPLEKNIWISKLDNLEKSKNIENYNNDKLGSDTELPFIPFE
ncbi:uncharacterized protein LOC107981718 [Nasonia vitripennis]|uniref:Uncharacterized protein n=1 Tax=Nasonia vitripennis TaxID=7425 RepID=A0A7M7M7Q3_NASVI|nr:uncharacterized protein LOC107981718 [Nasonia vitripennis]